MLTPEQREEGRRLLALISRESQPIKEWATNSSAWEQWLEDNIDALLADPEEIKRSAVREFAEAVHADFLEQIEIELKRSKCATMVETRIEYEARAEEWSEAAIRLEQFAAARGVTLNTEPQR